ncbi:MAG: MFS transporter [Intrasporangium sp.]|uniref:MFS transporter n=1 Tax=Intrasporangium sp. TaxID=1925024 RepID=UPI003F815887
MSTEAAREAAPTQTLSEPAPRLLSRAHLPVVLGVLSLVTLAAFENRAVVSILPTVVHELDGWSLFGAATGAPLVTLTVAMAWSGPWTDRQGPGRVLLTGIGLFAVAQLISGSASHMGVFVAGRAVSGAAEALIDTAMTVLVARALPETLRAKVFASFAAAWILPSVLGPGVAGGIDAVVGWRAVFVAPLAIVPVSLALVRGALRGERGSFPAADAPGPETASSDGRQLRASFLLAVGLAAMTCAGPLLGDREGARVMTGLALVVGGLVVIAGTASRVLPRGTLRLHCGVPSLVALRFIVALAFTGVGGTIPLMLVQTRGVGPALAGTSLAVTGVLWAAGSWLNSTGAVQRVRPAARLRAGHASIAVGALGPVLLSLGVLGLPAGMVGWGLAALGMGLVSPTLTTEALALAPEREQGRASAAMGLASTMGVAVPTGVVGVVVAMQGAGVDGRTFALLMAACAVAALVGAGGAGRAWACD